MKKTVLRTVLATLGILLILLLSVFGVMSLCSPSVMAEFTSSVGLTGLSGDYCYQEYERTGEIAYLARSFEIAAEYGSDRKAEERFTAFYGHEDFSAYCTEQGEIAYTASDGAQTALCGYRFYVCGKAACIRYRLSAAEEEYAAVCDFALSETDSAFSAGNPVVFLTVEAAGAEDAAFCALLLERLDSAAFEGTLYQSIVDILEGCANE